VKVSAFVAPLVAIVCALALVANQASAQGLRRQMRAQKKLEKKLDRQNSDQENLATANGTRSEAAPARPTTPQAEKHSLDGIRQRGIRSFFTQEEATLIIPGFAQSPVALLIIFRQLDLTPEQKERIRNIRRRVGRSLVQTRSELAMLEQQLDEAIYGTNDPGSLDNYDPKRVEELAERVAVKRVELMKLQTGIESQLRQILTPDQFFVFKELIREILLPGRRPGAAIQRQQQMQRRMGVPQN
jgi:Spy/CpxP family protein refolding chaperone